MRRSTHGGTVKGGSDVDSRPSLDCTKHLNQPDPAVHRLVYEPPREEFRVSPLDLDEAHFRHSGWAGRRRRVFDALKRVHVNDGRLDRFANCGSSCSVQHSPSTGQFRLAANYCRDRCCQVCGAARSNKIADALCAHGRGRCLRFATFTVKHNDLPLTEQITRVYTAFSTLRRRAWWKQHVNGGVAILEVKIGRDRRWHVHLHTLLEGSYLPQKDLAAEWYAVTGDSYIVDVRSVGTNQREVRYVAAYAGKPLDASIVLEEHRLDEFILAIKGRRLALTFGTFRGLDLDATDPDAPTDWVSIGSLRELLCDARRGEPTALELLRLLLRRDPLRLPSDVDREGRAPP